jgi:diacylglycerol kinase family enzyme
MRIVLLFNPIAGSGKAHATAEAVDRELARAGHSCVLVATQMDPPIRWLDRELEGADVLAVVGGDGAVRLASDAALRTGTPIYHLPLGTENLFAREFGMRRDARQFLAALERGKLREIDVGFANGHLFLLMVSIGFDAEVIAELTRVRRGSISHVAYVRPILSQVFRWKPQPIDLRIDGERVTNGVPGWVIVANCRQYGMRLDFARRASVDDGLLDVVFMPTAAMHQVIRWLLAARVGLHLRSRHLLYRTGRVVEVTTDEPQRVQLDGDLPHHAWAAPESSATPSSDDLIYPSRMLRVTTRPGAIRVLLPPEMVCARNSCRRA